MAKNLSLKNVINVTLVPSASGLSSFKTSNLLLYTPENPISDWGNDKYRLYYGASAVAEDFGVDSLTYKMAVGVFSQSPNILSNAGVLIIAIREGEESQLEAFNRLKSQVLFCGWMTACPIEDDIEANQYDFTKPALVRAKEEMDSVETIKALVNPNLLLAKNVPTDESSSASIDYTEVEFDFSEDNSLEDIKNTIESTLKEQLQNENWGTFIVGNNLFGIFCDEEYVQNIVVGDTELASALKIASSDDPDVDAREDFHGITDPIQTENNKINFVVSNNSDDIEGLFQDLADRGNKKTRCLFYGGTETEAKVMMASYASKAMSTIFEASLTTQTMHLKPLTGVVADPVMTETLLGKCKDNGVDTYISIAGIACVFSTGKNGFFDEVFNELWFVNALQVAGFNYLRQTNTKIPQIEDGMDGLKNAYAQVCVRGVNNGFIGAGTWTLPDTFGNPDLFKRNIETKGYYIYSQPIAQQPKEEREERKAPLVQIAIKTAGAIHSTDVMIYVNL